MYVDDEEKCVFYPSSGAGGQVLAMNGVPSIEVCFKITFIYKIVNVSGSYSGSGLCFSV